MDVVLRGIDSPAIRRLDAESGQLRPSYGIRADPDERPGGLDPRSHGRDAPAVCSADQPDSRQAETSPTVASRAEDNSSRSTSSRSASPVVSVPECVLVM